MRAISFVLLLVFASFSAALPFAQSTAIEYKGCRLWLNEMADDVVWVTLKSGTDGSIKAEGNPGSTGSDRFENPFIANPGDIIRVRAIDTKPCGAGFGKPIGFESWDIFKTRWMGYEPATIVAASPQTFLPSPIILPNSPVGMKVTKYGKEIVDSKIITNFDENEKVWKFPEGCGAPWWYPAPEYFSDRYQPVYKEIEWYRPEVVVKEGYWGDDGAYHDPVIERNPAKGNAFYDSGNIVLNHKCGIDGFMDSINDGDIDTPEEANDCMKRCKELSQAPYNAGGNQKWDLIAENIAANKKETCKKKCLGEGGQPCVDNGGICIPKENCREPADSPSSDSFADGLELSTELLSFLSPCEKGVCCPRNRACPQERSCPGSDAQGECCPKDWHCELAFEKVNFLDVETYRKGNACMPDNYENLPPPEDPSCQTVPITSLPDLQPLRLKITHGDLDKYPDLIGRLENSLDSPQRQQILSAFFLKEMATLLENEYSPLYEVVVGMKELRESLEDKPVLNAAITALFIAAKVEAHDIIAKKTGFGQPVAFAWKSPKGNLQIGAELLNEGGLSKDTLLDMDISATVSKNVGLGTATVCLRSGGDSPNGQFSYFKPVRGNADIGLSVSADISEGEQNVFVSFGTK
ncbi:hypothetical protein HYV84_06055 [Candidatus Woesearchaeota archaeon]|nr:hypothetical protein [Candidatus Woesearchaeota archaeon]